MPPARDQVTTLLGTGEVARICNVSESTVKRWADEGSLRCIRTLGGHRRFLVQELRQFLAAHRFETPAGLALESAADPDPEGVALYALNDEYDRVVGRLADRALRRDTESVHAILRTLHSLGIPLETILQRTMAPALSRLIGLGERGEVSPVAAQVAIGRAEEALVLLKSRLDPRPIGRRALVVALAPEPPSLPVRLAAVLLHGEGWSVSMPRGVVAIEALAELLARERIDLACVPAFGGVDPAALDAAAESFQAAGTPLVVMVRPGPRPGGPVPGDRIAHDIPSLLEASREL